MNKREFVRGGCGALAALASGSTVGAVDGVAAVPFQQSIPVGLRRQRMPDLATDARLSAWKAYVGHGFRAGTSGASAELMLDGVAACACQPGFEQFSLHFVAEPGASVGSGTHVLHHPTGQRVAVYLEEIAEVTDAAHRLRADFNLVV